MHFGAVMASGPVLGFASVAQNLNLKRELYGPVAKFSVLGFQSLEQIPIVRPFSTPGIRSLTGLAGPRKLENGSGFLAVR
jgi:hypothetical protein